MDENLLHSGSGDAIAREWELPELPSGTPSLGSTPSLPTSQELAEIFGTSDDEDDDFPFPMSSGLHDIGPSTTASAAQGDVQSQSAAAALFSSLLGLETAPETVSLVSPQPPGRVAYPPTSSNTGATDSSQPQRKSTRLSSKSTTATAAVAVSGVKTESKREEGGEGTRKVSPPSTDVAKLEKKFKISEKVKGMSVATATKAKQDREVKAADETMEEAREGEKSEEEDDEDEEEESVSDDPDRLWCICRKPHNDRFMICCDLCEEWFHGDCVGISVSQGRRMERAGQEYICPVCTERSKLEKEIKSASRMARQAKREEMREARQKHLTEKHSKDPHRKRSLSGSLSGVAKEGGDNYGIDLLFQPDNAPPRSAALSGEAEDSGGREEKKKKSFYRGQTDSSTPSCHAPQCSAQTTPPSIYCSDACIEKYAAESLNQLSRRGITFESDPSEFVRGSKGISMVDKATGKTVIGIQAPTDKTLVSWLKQHPSYQVLMPSGKRGRELGAHSRPKRVKTESERDGEEEVRKRETDRPSKARSLNDPETVRMNAKKALFQTLWRRKEAVDDVEVTQEEVEKIANKIEEKLFNLHGNISTKYKTKYRSLLFNLKDSKNQGLFRKVCLGQISPSDLVKMKSEQYASDELAEWREKTLKKDLDKIVEREEEARSSKKVIRKITYKGEVEIEAEKTEAIETIAPPEEETPSTPLTPTATLKPVVQSQDGTKHHAQSPHGTKPPVQSNDGAKPSDNGATVSGDTDETKSKPVVVPKQEAPKPKQSKDIKLKTVASAKSEPGAKTEAKPSAGKEAEPEKEKQGGGGVLDLLTDTTAQHGEHIYHPQCQICLGKKSPPPAKAETPHDEDSQNSSTDVEEMQTDSVPLAIPLLWEGLVDMPGTIAFTSTAYPVSGSTEYITTVLPSTLHVMGRIANKQVWDYIDKLRVSNTREIVVLRFDWTEEDRDGYEGMLNYLVRKERCGVVEEQLHGIKDFYLVPLMVDQATPHQLLPFSGPGLPDDRPNLILGVVIQTKGIQPDVPPDFSLTSSQYKPLHSSSGNSSRSLKRHWSTGSDDPDTSTVVKKRKPRKKVTVGFGGATPPLPDDEDDTLKKSPENEGQGGEKVNMSFYGRHQSSSDSNGAAKNPTQPPPQIKSILSQLSDEKLKELASAMSNIEESTTATSQPSEVSTSTVTSPATGQMVTASPFSGPTHSVPAAAVTNHPPSEAVSLARSEASGGDVSNRQQQAPFHHQTPHISKLQRPPLHPASYGPSGEGQPPPLQYHNQEFGTSPGYNTAAWGSTNNQQPYQPQAYGGGSGLHPVQNYQGGPPPGQYPAPQPHHGSPHQFPGSPQQQYSNPHPQGPPNPHAQPPPHQYSANQMQPYPPQHYDAHHHYPQHGGRDYRNEGPNRGWHHDAPRQHPQQHHAQYYDGGEARFNEMETRDYGHRSQPPASWRDRERGRDRERERHGWRNNYRDRR